MGSFKQGSFKVATKTNCPIVPVCFTNSEAVLERFPIIRKKHVIITFLDPIVPDDLDPEDKKHIAPYVQNLMQAQLDKDAQNI